MGLVAVGISHKTAPVALRERLSIPAAELGNALQRLVKAQEIQEAVILSTCNRLEVYARPASDRAAAVRSLRTFFQNVYDGLELAESLYQREAEDAVAHLFRVSAGLDSLVVGETEILGQVKAAYLFSQSQGATGKITNVLFQRALFVGKHIRTKTRLSEGSSSVGSVAVQLAEKIFGSLQDHRVLLLGAGEMAEVTARHLMSQKIGSLMILNRTLEKAQALAAQLGGEAASLDQLSSELLSADIVICSIASDKPLITRDEIEACMKARKGRSLYLIDIAVPRNVDPAANGIDNVYVYNMDDLQALVEKNLDRRRQEVDQAEALVSTLSREFYDWVRATLEGKTTALKHTP
jgi:glutamyl-tRNA reductase